MPVASTTFRWTEAYVKIALLDQQDHKMLNTANQLVSVLRRQCILGSIRFWVSRPITCGSLC